MKLSLNKKSIKELSSGLLDFKFNGVGKNNSISLSIKLLMPNKQEIKEDYKLFGELFQNFFKRRPLPNKYIKLEYELVSKNLNFQCKGVSNCGTQSSVTILNNPKELDAFLIRKINNLPAVESKKISGILTSEKTKNNVYRRYNLENEYILGQLGDSNFKFLNFPIYKILSTQPERLDHIKEMLIENGYEKESLKLDGMISFAGKLLQEPKNMKLFHNLSEFIIKEETLITKFLKSANLKDKDISMKYTELKDLAEKNLEKREYALFSEVETHFDKIGTDITKQILHQVNYDNGRFI